MNIVMFTNTYYPHIGGVAKSVQSLTDDLRMLGHKVLVVAPTFPDTEVDFRPADGVVRVPALQNFNGSDFSVRLPVPFALSATLDDFKPDLVHSHHPFLLGDSAIRFARTYNIPIVFTHHTRYEHYTHYVPADSERMRHFASQLATEYANLCTGVVAPSDSIRGLIRERGVTATMVTIPTGVDTEAFSRCNTTALRHQLKLTKNVRLIGHVGRLAPEKNLAYLSQTVILALQQNTNLHFAIAGDGPCREMMESLFQEKNLIDRVTFCGKLQGQALIDFYAGLDLFLFASTTETQGMVVAEAMAAGTPVIALDAPGVREVVNVSNGRLLATNVGEAALARAINEELVELQQNTAKVNAAIQTARILSRHICTCRMVAFYEQCIEQFQAGKNEGLPETLELLIKKLHVEWELINEKTAAIVNSLQE